MTSIPLLLTLSSSRQSKQQIASNNLLFILFLQNLSASSLPAPSIIPLIFAILALSEDLGFGSSVRAPQVLSEPGEGQALHSPTEDDAGDRPAFLTSWV